MSKFDPNNHTHIMLRDMHKRQDITLTYLERISEDVHDLKVRVTAVETAVVGVQRRIDRVESRLDRLETRAGLVDDVFRENQDPFKGPDA